MDAEAMNTIPARRYDRARMVNNQPADQRAISIRVTPDVYAAFEKRAKQVGITKCALGRQLIEREVEAAEMDGK